MTNPTLQTETGKVKIIQEIKDRLKLLEVDKTVVIDEAKNTRSYLYLIGFTVLIGFGAVALLTWLRPDFDFAVVAISVFAVVTTITTNVFAIIKSSQAEQASRRAERAQYEMKGEFNHKLDEFREAIKAIEFAKGKEAGREQEQDRADKKELEKKPTV